MNRHLVFTATLAALLTTACAGSDPAGTSTAATSDSSASAPSTSAADTGTVDAGTASVAPSAAGDVCATVPSLDAMSAVLDEPVTTLTALPRGAGEAACEATGDGVSSVQFGTLTGVTADAMREQITEMGNTVTDLTDPAGGFAYAGTAVAVIDGTAYSVQAITFDVITDPNTPEAIERSAGLLRQWLALMGLA